MVLLIVLVAAVIAAGVAFAVSIAPSIHVDPIDPAAETQAVRRSLRQHPKVRRFVRERLDRSTAGGFMLTAGFAIIIGMAAALGALLTLIDGSGRLRSIDNSIAAWGSKHATSRAVDVIKLVTNFGTTWVVLVVLAIVATIDFLRRRNREVFVFVAAVGLGELLLNNLIKAIVQRERPSVLRLMDAGGYSFPSGHTAAAAAAWSAVALILGRDRRRLVRGLLAGGAALIACIVATSRALLGVHWFSDVLGGLALGWGWFLLVAVVFGGRRQRLGDPVVDVAQPTTADVRHTSGPELEHAAVSERIRE